MTPDPVTAALSALKERALAADAEEESWPFLRDAMRDACSPALIAALCDVARLMPQARNQIVAWMVDQVGAEAAVKNVEQYDAALDRLAAVIKEAGAS